MIAIAPSEVKEIINSALASGTMFEPTSTKNPQRIQAESGLANACSCEMVETTATVTSQYTVRPVVGELPRCVCEAYAAI